MWNDVKIISFHLSENKIVKFFGDSIEEYSTLYMLHKTPEDESL